MFVITLSIVILLENCYHGDIFVITLYCSYSSFSSINVSKLEPEVRDKLQESHPNLKKVYFNKGL